MARNDHSGYPLKWFKDQNATRHAYECVICLEVLKDPVQVRDCGHQFCALCIDDILKTDPRCPSCRIKISDAMIFEDHAAKRLIKQLLVNCCNEGCSWQGCLSSLVQNHQNNCNFLINRDNDAHQLKVEELEEKHDTLLLKIVILEQKNEDDIKQLKLKHEQDIRDLQLKHQQEKQDIQELKVKYEQEKNLNEEFKLKHEQDMKELKLMFEQAEKRWQQLLIEKEKDLSSEKKLPKTAVFDNGLVEPVGYLIERDQKDDKVPAAAVEQKRQIKYDREFLLQFRYKPVCLEKPANLPEAEIVLDYPNMPGEGTGSQREGRKNVQRKYKRAASSHENQESRNGKPPKEPAKGLFEPRLPINYAATQPHRRMPGIDYETYLPRHFNPGEYSDESVTVPPSQPSTQIFSTAPKRLKPRFQPRSIPRWESRFDNVIVDECDWSDDNDDFLVW